MYAWESSRATLALHAPADEDFGAAAVVVDESVPRSLTVTAHDGRDGQVTAASGALTFRTGDVFSGRDQEQMRITPEGRVGIGTAKPEAALDVAGDVRASGVVRADQGVAFSDGTTLKAEGGKLVVRDAAGDSLPGPLPPPPGRAPSTASPSGRRRAGRARSPTRPGRKRRA